MATQNITGGTPFVERPAAWHYWVIDFTSIGAAEATVNTLTTLPIGSVVLDAVIIVTRAETVSTTPTANIAVAATTLINAAPLTAVGHSNTIVANTLGTATAAMASATGAVTFVTVRAGSAPGVFPRVIAGICVGRVP